MRKLAVRVKNTGGWRNEKGNHPRGRLESEVGRDGSSGGESIGVGVGRGEKRRPCVIRDDDGMQRRHLVLAVSGGQASAGSSR